MDLLEFAWKLSQMWSFSCIAEKPACMTAYQWYWLTHEGSSVYSQSVSSLLLLLSPFASYPFKERTAYWIKAILYTACVQLALISDLRWRISLSDFFVLFTFPSFFDMGVGNVT